MGIRVQLKRSIEQSNHTSLHYGDQSTAEVVYMVQEAESPHPSSKTRIQQRGNREQASHTYSHPEDLGKSKTYIGCMGEGGGRDCPGCTQLT